MRLNVGCGQTPTEGWRNFDNSWSLRLARVRWLPEVLHRLNLVEHSPYEFMQFARESGIEYGDVVKGLPVPDGAASVFYSSHVLEHLDRTDADSFMKEIHRVLRPGGIVRISVPDLAKQVELYCESGDADAFMESTRLSVPRPRGAWQSMKALVVGPRHHQWMYDSRSLSQLLQRHGFVDVRARSAGETSIEEPDHLDLFERASVSAYVEGEKPHSTLQFAAEPR